MGFCYSKNIDIKFITKQFKNINQFDNIQFTLSDNKIKTFESDVLVIFVDESRKFKRNIMLLHNQQNAIKFLQQAYDAKYETQQTNKQIIIFENQYNNYQMKYICVVKFQQWNIGMVVSDCLLKLFAKVLDQCIKRQCKSFCFLELNKSMGFPVTAQSKAFFYSIIDRKQQVQKFLYIFNDQTHINIFAKVLKQFQDDNVSSFHTSASKNQSLYF